MHDAGVVRGCQRIRHLHRVLQRLGHRQAFAADQLTERSARHAFHGDEVDAFGLIDVVGRDDVRMV